MTDTSWNIKDLHAFSEISKNNQLIQGHINPDARHCSQPSTCSYITFTHLADAFIQERALQQSIGLTSPQERNKESSAGLQDTHDTGIEWPG